MRTLVNRSSIGGRHDHIIERELTRVVDGADPSEDSATSAGRGVYVVPRFLDHETCIHLRAEMGGGRSAGAEVLTATYDSDAHVRRASSIEVTTATIDAMGSRFDAERGALSRFFGMSLAAREGSDFLRYQTGGFYRPHRDRGTVVAWPSAARRRVAAVVFLNDAETHGVPGAFSGGELRLLDVGVVVVPREGWLVAFSASLLHEVAPVARGVRDVIVDWFYE